MEFGMVLLIVDNLCETFTDSILYWFITKGKYGYIAIKKAEIYDNIMKIRVGRDVDEGYIIILLFLKKYLD